MYSVLVGRFHVSSTPQDPLAGFSLSVSYPHVLSYIIYTTSGLLLSALVLLSLILAS
ncbi:hypothetical protein P175DRAFT_0497600 [Aspergillus ochraceoroseus IBT 24754]|uniref:Uncharacterized protein n=1 Tax=Aspergillus ochraceoroseus IBT 24754 TaxID=1392256 RepID=A0A2T5M7F2_9EURO|nr:uncharacterized protein P175DRAFT_0497600 [Aspergillus ochraceoroseus IBT 24754]PTU24471.1 hypothetical protein P175DRAFT_0497600 [Aspergillus ochraceoroseus IBT 24754]